MCNFSMGEWKVHSVGSQFAVGPLSSVDDQSNGMMNVVAWIEKFDYFTEKQSEYNAHLIAAAPEMYAELQEISNWANSQLGMGDWHKDIEKLLTKARGEHV